MHERAIVEQTRGALVGSKLRLIEGRLVEGSGCLAPVGDAFGGRGGIAQYNRDLLGALANSGLVSSVSILPRRAPDPVVLPGAIQSFT